MVKPRQGEVRSTGDRFCSCKSSCGPADGRCRRHPSGASSSRGCKSASCPGSCGRAIPARCGCRRRHRAGAWRNCGGACAGCCGDRARSGRCTFPGAGRPSAVVSRRPKRFRKTAGLLRSPRSEVRSSSQILIALRAGVAEQGQPLALALAANGDQAVVEIEIVQIEADQFADAQTGGIERFEHGPVARARGAWRPGRRPVLPMSASAMKCGNRFSSRGPRKPVGRIALEHAADAQEPAPGADGREPAGDRGAGVILSGKPRQIGANEPGRQRAAVDLAAGHLAGEILDGLREVFPIRLDGQRGGVLLKR